MRTFLFLLAALLCKQSCAQSTSLGFPEQPFSAVEGEEYDVCVETFSGQTSIDFLFLTRIYAIDVCSLPPETGPCRASIPRYYYDRLTEQCLPFTYGGCRGNGNNFETVQECEQRCENTCSLPPETGPCRAKIPRYYYSGTFDRCLPFTYGGCGGNSNNFETIQLCEDDCGGSSATPAIDESFGISGPFVAGEVQCNTFSSANNEYLDSGDTIIFAIVPPLVNVTITNPETTVQIFDDDSIQVQFESPFVTVPADQEDVEICLAVSATGPTRRAVPLLFYTFDICSLPPVTGPCRGDFPRYYFNSRVGGCLSFTYGGCGGNGNNFETLQECEQRCNNTIGWRKTILIPPGTEGGDRICLNVTVPVDSNVTFYVNVQARDVSVIAPDLPVLVFVEAEPEPPQPTEPPPPTEPPVCRDPMFSGDTPMVRNGRVFTTLSPAVCGEMAMCRFAGDGMDTEVPCSGVVRIGQTLSRRTLVVSIPTSRNLRRDLRRDSEICDTHLINEGFSTNQTGDVVLMFAGTAPDNLDVTEFRCEVRDVADNVLIPRQDCGTPFIFSDPGTDTLCVNVRVANTNSQCESRIATTYCR